jgi:hypothetical protein
MTRPYSEPLLLGLASLAVFAGGWLLYEVSSSALDGVGLGAALIYVPGLAILGYVAGQRRSSLGLLAVIVTYLAALLVRQVLPGL